MICRITSMLRSDRLAIAIQKWESAGLAKPSVVRSDRLVTAEKTLLTRYLRRLHVTDKAEVKAAWNLMIL